MPLIFKNDAGSCVGQTIKYGYLYTCTTIFFLDSNSLFMHISSGDLLHRRGAADGFNSQRRLLGATAQHRPEVSEPTQYANRHTGYDWRYSKGCCRCD